MKEEDFIKFYNEHLSRSVSSMDEIKTEEYGPYSLLDFVEQAIQHQKILDEYRTGNIRLPETMFEENEFHFEIDKSKIKSYGPSLKPYCCPVCGGKGMLPNGFYNFGSTSSDLSPEQCRSCDGKGVIWG